MYYYPQLCVLILLFNLYIIYLRKDGENRRKNIDGTYYGTANLYAKNKGLEFYESILKDASKILNDKFLIAFEIGQEQGEMVKKIALKYLSNIKVEIKKDLSLKNRFVFVYNF